jgi:hypothetical protein
VGWRAAHQPSRGDDRVREMTGTRTDAAACMPSGSIDPQ